MHTATLLHDDVVDESGLRRGKQTARMLWGNQASVLVGDFLLGQAFRMLVDVGSLPVLKILSNAAAVIAEGEVMQLAAAKNTTTTEDEYLAIIDAKTAALFSAAAEVGAAIANRPAAEQTALKSYGRNLGLAFQLVDDALDYSGDSANLGKAIGDDFREGKITLPVILSFRRGSDEERGFWKRTMADGDIVDGDLERAVALMKQHKALWMPPWSGPARTGRLPTTRWPSSRTGPKNRPCRTLSGSACTARTEKTIAADGRIARRRPSS